MHLTSSPLDWYAARAAGVAAYVMLSVVVLLGITMAGRKTLKRWPRFAVEDVHRFGGLLVGTFIGIHVLTIAIDSYLPFSVGALVIPLVSTYKPLWVALGIVAAELLLALAVTNHYRDRLDYAFWRKAHYLNFAVWAAAGLHGLGSGTDRSAAVARRRSMPSRSALSQRPSRGGSDPGCRRCCAGRLRCWRQCSWSSPWWRLRAGRSSSTRGAGTH